VAAAVWDWKHKKIPNYLTVPILLLGLFYHVCFGEGLLFALSGFAVGFGALLPVMLAGGGGAGDVKLVGSLGVWLGWQGVLIVLAVSCILATIGMCCAMLFQQSKRVFFRSPELESPPAPESTERAHELEQVSSRPVRKIAFAVPICLATWLYLLFQRF
jgi:prepilin peptidase CpaA